MSQWTFSTIRVQVASTRHIFNVMALLLLPVLCLVGLIGNGMVCIAIATDRRLHNVTNYFLFSLALADLFVCLLVMPLSIIVEVRNGVWTWNVLMCLLYVYADVFLCSASIVHMSVISLDRYLGISQPLRTRNKSKTMIFVEISLVWIITLIISCPIAVLGLYDNTNILKNNSCMIFNRHYIIYGSTLTFLIPFCVMFVTYLRTTSLLNKQASILSQKANDSVNGSGLRRTMPHRKLGYVRTNSASTYTNGTLKSTKYSDGMKTSTTSYSNGYNPSISEIDIPSLLANDAINNQKDLEKQSIISLWKSRTSYYISSIALRVCRRNSLQAASQELANEHKATRVLAVVFVCFFICWTPFFVANFIIGFCGESCSMPAWLGSVFLWLGYISSTINPIIYTVFNKRFRQAFIRILRCQCHHVLRDPNSIYSRNYTNPIPDTYTLSNHERDRTVSVNGRDDHNNSTGCIHQESREWKVENEIHDKNKKSSLPNMSASMSKLVIQSPRAVTVNINDAPNEQKSLVPPRITTPVAMKRSFTGLLSSNANEIKKLSYVDGQKTEPTKTSAIEDTLPYPLNDCSHHFTLFSYSLSKPVKETFL